MRPDQAGRIVGLDPAEKGVYACAGARTHYVVGFRTYTDGSQNAFALCGNIGASEQIQHLERQPDDTEVTCKLCAYNLGFGPRRPARGRAAVLANR